MTGRDGPFVKATLTSFEVLEAVRELDGAGVSELARYLDRSKSGVHKHVQTLADGGYVHQRGNSYHIGLGLWVLGAAAGARFPIDDGRDAVDSLAASVDRTVSLVLYEEGTAVVAHVNAPSETEPVDRSVGDVLPLHATASGKVILAYASEEDRARIIGDSQYTAFTDETITDPDTLRAEIDGVRDRRTAVDREEHATGVECVAAPIMKTPDEPVGAISVSGRIHEFDGRPIEESVQGLVVSASRSVENSIGEESD